MHHTPVCITFALFEDSSVHVLDPSHLETLLATTMVHLSLNAQRELCVLSKAGGLPMSVNEIMVCLQVAEVRAKALTELLTQRLETDWKGRIVELR